MTNDLKWHFQGTSLAWTSFQIDLSNPVFPLLMLGLGLLALVLLLGVLTDQRRKAASQGPKPLSRLFPDWTSISSSSPQRSTEVAPVALIP